MSIPEAPLWESPKEYPVHHMIAVRWGWMTLLFTLGASEALGLSITNVTTSGTQVGLYQKFEVTFGLDRGYANPHDPSLVDARFRFTGPSGVMREIPAFYRGTAPGWAARIVPLELGQHTCQIVVDDHTGESASYQVVFHAVASNERGFVRIDNRNPTYLRFDNGDPYHPLGMNLCWGGNQTIFYTWLDEMQAVGVNWTRYWMVPFVSQGIEWGPGTDNQLGTYSQSQSQMFDSMFEGARQRGIQVQLAMDSYNGWNTTLFDNWDASPYNTANGGMCSRPLDYFILESAKVLARQRMRYIVARWGYNPAILAWEFFNEIDALNGGGATFWGHEQEIAAWHSEMGQYIRSIDPFEHLRTTSFADDGYFSSYSIFWSLPEMDIVEAHEYSILLPQAHVQKVREREIFGKPIVVGEGNYAGSPGSLDSNGGSLHTQIWAGAVVESGVMSWWWDNWIYPNDLYYHFAPLAAYLNGEDWAPLGLEAISTTKLSGPNVEVYGSSGPKHAFAFIRYTPGTASGLQLRLNQLSPDEYDVEFWDTNAGTIIQAQQVTAGAQGLVLNFPTFTWDVAIKVKAVAPLLEVDPEFISIQSVVTGNPPDTSFTVTNSGAELLQYIISDNASWLDVFPINGNSSGESDPISVQVDTEGLDVGTHVATITVNEVGGTQSAEIQVQLILYPIPGDFDGDYDVDLADFGHQQECMSPGDFPDITPGCLGADFNGDNFINGFDMAIFRNCMNGANMPVDPNCAS